MAYVQGQASKFKPAVTRTTSSSQSEAKEAILRTGLFKPTKEGVRAMASVKVKESVTIPAGSYINLYQNDDKKSETSPDYTLTIVEGKK